MSVRDINSSLINSLLTEEPFAYAHLVKFEKPANTTSGKSRQRAKDYSYITDGSIDILFDDGSTDIDGNSNGTQTYVANKLSSVGSVTETVEARASSINLQLFMAALDVSVTDTYNITATTLTGTQDLVAQGFREGDLVLLSGSGLNNNREVRIEGFRNNNTVADVTVISTINNLGNKVQITALTNETSALYTLSFASPEVNAIFDNREGTNYARYINRDVFVYKAHINPNTGAIIGEPYLIFKGIIASGKATESASGKSVISWSVSSHWGDFVQVAGRKTSDETHRALDGSGIPDSRAAIRPEYATDLGFAHSEQALNIVSIYQVKETRYKTKYKKGFLGIGAKVKTKEYQVDVDREVDLRFNLDAKYLPVVYGVNKIDSIPVFVDTLASDSKQVYVAYALCEGPIGGIYDIYFDDTSSICLDGNDFDTRSSQTEENTVDVLCTGRMDRGDTLTPQSTGTGNTTIITGNPYAAGGRDWYDEYREAFYDEYEVEDVAATFLSGASANASGITHEKGTSFTTPIDTRLVFHAGLEDQKADSLLVSKSGQFKVQSDYFTGTASEYWGANHRLLDTAYVVCEYTIGEGETTIPSLDFVVRGKGISCFNYDYSYEQNQSFVLTDDNRSAFNLGEQVTLKRTSDGTTLTTATIADIYTLTNTQGTQVTRVKFTSDPQVSGSFYIEGSGGAVIHLNTYDSAEENGTISAELKETISEVIENADSVDITFEQAQQAFLDALADTNIKVSIVALADAIEGLEPGTEEYKNNYIDFVVSQGWIEGLGQTGTGGQSLVDKTIVIKNAVALSALANASDNYYVGNSIKIRKVYPDNSIKTFTREIIAYNGTTKIATLKSDLPDDGIPSVGDTYTILTASEYVGGDSRVSTNPALQLLDYLTSKRYGKGLDIDTDINLNSFLEAARACDTGSDVNIIVDVPTVAPTTGAVYKYQDSNGKVWFQGTLAQNVTNSYNGTRSLRFTNVLGKFGQKWADWKTFADKELFWHLGNAYEKSGAGSVADPTVLTPITSVTLTKVSGTGDATLTVNLDKATFEGNPFVRNQTLGGQVSSGYSLYDSDDVKYWRYLGWEEPNQRFVTRHQTNAVINTSTPIFDNINNMLGQFNGILRYSNGKYGLAIKGSYAGSTIINVGGTNYEIESISEDDIIGDISIEDAGQKGTFNQVSITIDDPQNRFEGRSITLFNSDYLKQDRAIPKKTDFRLPNITNYYNARINAKQILEESRYSLKVSFTLGPRGVLLLAGDLIRLNNRRFGWTNKLFRIVNLTFNENCLVQITAEEHNDSAYLLEQQTSSSVIKPVEATTANQATPTAPTNLQATQSEKGGITLTWSNSTKFNAATYTAQIWRSSDNNRANAELIGTSKGNTYTDQITSIGKQTRYYWIRYAVLAPSQRATTVAQKEIFSAYLPTGITAGVSGICSGSLDGISINLTNDNATVPSTESGPDFSNTGTTISVNIGTQPIEYDGVAPYAEPSFRISNITETNVVADTTPTTTLTTYTLDPITSFTGDTGKIEFEITLRDSLGAEATFTKVQTFSRAANGDRGPGRWNVPVASLPTTSTQAQTAWDATWTNRPGNPVADDQAWFYTGTETNQTGQSVWLYTGSGWVNQNELIDGQVLINESVGTDQIGNCAITSVKISDNAINSNKIGANQIIASLIAANQIIADLIASNQILARLISSEAIITRHLTANSITSDKIAANSINTNELAANSITTDKLAANSVNTNTLAANSITSDKIAANSITSDLIAANAISTNELAANSITSDKIAANQITTNQLAANSVNTNTLAANSITSDKIAANQITTNQLAANSVNTNTLAANSITSDKIAANSITSDLIAANAISTNELAANSITSDKIAANSITSDLIAANAISTNELAANSITSDKIAANSITSDLIAANAITSDLIAANAISTNELAANSITSDLIAANAISTNELAANSVNTNTLAANAVSSRSIGSGAVNTDQLEAGAVTTDKLAANIVTSDKLAVNSVIADKIAANSITTDKLAANSITTDKLAANSVTTNTLAANSITSDKISANSISTTYLKANVITTEKLAADSITTAKLSANAITADKIASNQITANLIAANAVTANKLAANSITSDKIAANSITSDLIAANAITSAEISAGSVTTDSLAANAITSDKIAANQITATQLSAGSVTTDTLAANAITTEKLAAGAVTADSIAAGAITSDKVKANSVVSTLIDAQYVTAAEVNVGTLSSIAADIGDITAGTLKGGTLPEADSAPQGSETGAFLDLTAGKMVFGSASRYIWFDGTDLILSGVTIDANSIVNASSKMKVQDSGGTATEVDDLNFGTNLSVTISGTDPVIATIDGKSDGDIRALFSAGAGLDYNNVSGTFSSNLTASTGISYNSTTGLIATNNIPNTALSNSSVTINGLGVSLGGSITLDTDDISELASPTNRWFTEARARSSISVTGSGSYDSGTGVITINGAVTSVNSKVGDVVLVTDDISEDGSPVNLWFTNARARSAVSHVDNGGLGSFSYSSATGVFSYTGPSNLEVRGLLSSGTGIAYNSSTGVIASTVTQYTDADARGSVSATDNGGLGSFSYASGTGVFTYTGPSNSDIRTLLSSGTGIAYNSSTGVIATNSIPNSSLQNSSITINGTAISLGGTRTLVTDDIAEDGSPTNLWFTNTRARSAVSASDGGGFGSFSYNSGTGVFTYTGISTTEIRETLTAGAGISYNSATGTIASTITQITTADIRSSVSASDLGGFGSFSYNSSTGVFSYTGASAADVRGSLSAGTGIAYNSTTGVIASTITQYSDSDARAAISVTGDGSYNQNTGVITIDPAVDSVNSKTGAVTLVTDDISEDGSPVNLWFTNARARAAVSASDAGGFGSFSYNSGTGVFTYTGTSESEVRNSVSASTGLAYNSTTGVFVTSNIPNSSLSNSSITINGTATSLGGTRTLVTDDIAEDGSPTNLWFTNTRARGAVSASDLGGFGSFSYNSSTGVFSYTGTSVANVRSSLVSGTGIAYNTASGVIATNNIPNSSLSNSSITINGTATSLGGTRTLVTDDIAEDGSPTNLWFTNTRARSAVSATDSGGFGSFSYNSSTGVFTYSGTTVSDIRTQFSGINGIAYNSSTGVIAASNVPNSSLQNSSITINGTATSLGGTRTLVTDDISEDGSPTNLWFTNTRARGAISASGSLSYNSGTGVISFTDAVTSVNTKTGAVVLNTDDVSEGTTNKYFSNTLARGAVSASDAGGFGSFSYNSGTGVFTYTGTSTADVRGSLVGGNGLAYNSVTGTFSVNAGALIDITSDAVAVDLSELTDMTADAVDTDELVILDAGLQRRKAIGEIGISLFNNDAGYQTSSGVTTVLAGNGLTGGGSTSSVTLNVGSGSGISVTADAIAVDSTVVRTSGDQTINGNKTFGNNVVINANLTVQGGITAIESNEVNIGDAIIKLNADETGVPSQNAGIEIERGTATNKTLLWDENAGKWTVGTETFVAAVFEGSISVNNIVGQLVADDFGDLTTDDLPEGTVNEYFTDARAQAAITAGAGLAKSVGTLSVNVTANELEIVSDSVGLADTTVTAAAYTGGISALTVDAKGRITSITGSAGYTTNTGDITAVTAGNGLTGGATSGAATLNVGAGSGISVSADAVAVDSTVLRTTTTFGGDVSGTYNAIVVSNDSHTHAFNNLTSKTSGTGDYATTGDLVSGKGSGGVALTVNDGYGNANVTWNHQDGIPEQNGNAARIEVNTDSTSGATMWFELKSGVTSGNAIQTASVMSLTETAITAASGVGFVGNLTGNASSADKWSTARTLALSGDASGSVSWDGSASAVLSVTVADDSHNHIIGNVDGLQTALDGKASLTGATFTGAITASGGIGGLTLANGISGTNYNITGVNQLEIADPGEGIVWKTGASGDITLATVDDATDNILRLSGTGASLQVGTNTVFHDGYHPNADKWTTARVLALSGDASGSVTWDGSASAVLSVTVANDSHTHDGRYYTETEADSRFVNVTGDTMTGDLTVSKVSPKIRLYDNDSATGTYGSLEWDSGNNQGVALQFNEFDGELPLAGYGLVLGPSSTNTQFPATGDLSFNVLGEIYAGAETLGSLNKVFHDGYHPNADKWTTARTLALSGDASGSVSWDGSASAVLSVTVADDSHNHIIGNVDGLQTALDGKLNLTGGTLTGNLSLTNTLTLNKSSGVAILSSPAPAGGNDPQFIRFDESTSNTGFIWIAVSDDFDAAATNDIFYVGDSNMSDYRFRILGSGEAYLTTGTVAGSNLTNHRIFADNYHPNADKWTTSRVLALSGDASGSVTWDGSASAVLSVTVANDSHTHDGRYYTETEADSRFVNVAGDTLTGTLNYRFLQNQTTTDYDTAGDASGFSVFYGTTGATNKPSGTDHAVTTLSYSAAWQVQEAADWRTNARYIRKQENGTWSAWQRLFADDYHPNADKWTTARQLSLSGDASGSVTWDGSASAVLAVTVANDSHTHDGRYYTETEADSRFFNVTGDTVTGDAYFNATTFWAVSAADAARQRADARDDATNYARLHWYGQSDTGVTSNFRHAWYDGAGYVNVTVNASGRLDFTGTAASMYIGSDRVFDDGYHPNADKWTTARQLSLSGDASGSVTWDGSASAVLSVTVADDSHNHIIGNVDGLQTALDAKLSLSGGTMTGTIQNNDSSRYWLATATNWGIYWDTTDNTIEFHGAGTDRWSVDLDNGNQVMAGDLTVNGGDIFALHLRSQNDQQVIISAGESDTVATGQTNELVYINAEAGLEVNSSPDNWTSGWAGRNTATICAADGTSSFPNDVSVNGLLTAVEKSFTINHPTKEGMKLRYGSLEGPENGVYVRGISKEKVIELPDYWTGLVHEDSITVQLTSIGKFQKLSVSKIENNKIYIKNSSWFAKTNYSYVVYGERKDVNRLVTEYKEDKK